MQLSADEKVGFPSDYRAISGVLSRPLAENRTGQVIYVMLDAEAETGPVGDEHRRLAHNKRNNESQARNNFVNSALRQARRHEQSSFIAFAFSPELVMRRAVCGPEVGNPAVAAMLTRVVEGLVRRLKSGLDPAIPQKDLCIEEAEAIVHKLRRCGLLAEVAVKPALEVLTGTVLSCCFKCYIIHSSQQR